MATTGLQQMLYMLLPYPFTELGQESFLLCLLTSICMHKQVDTNPFGSP